MTKKEPRSDLVESFLSRPYYTRQLIVVAADQIVEAERRAKLEAEQIAEVHKDKGFWERFTTEIKVRSRLNLAVVLVDLGTELIKAWQELRRRGINVRLVSRTEAEEIDFQPGHPRDRVLYIAHPVMRHVYYPASQFHRLNFEHKASEAVGLLMELGATEINVRHIEGWSTEMGLSVGGSQPQIEASAKGERHSKGASEIVYRFRLEGTGEPRLPDDLVWYEHEPAWMKIADGRLKFGLRDFALTLRYEDDYGVNAGFKLAIEKAGLDLGERFQDYQSTRWDIDGKFR